MVHSCRFPTYWLDLIFWTDCQLRLLSFPLTLTVCAAHVVQCMYCQIRCCGLFLSFPLKYKHCRSKLSNALPDATLWSAIIIIIIDRFYKALFSSRLSELRVAFYCEWVTVSLCSAHFLISSPELFGCYMAGATWSFCTMPDISAHRRSVDCEIGRRCGSLLSKANSVHK